MPPPLARMQGRRVVNVQKRKKEKEKLVYKKKIYLGPKWALSICIAKFKGSRCEHSHLEPRAQMMVYTVIWALFQLAL